MAARPGQPQNRRGQKRKPGAENEEAADRQRDQRRGQAGAAFRQARLEQCDLEPKQVADLVGQIGEQSCDRALPTGPIAGILRLGGENRGSSRVLSQFRALIYPAGERAIAGGRRNRCLDRFARRECTHSGRWPRLLVRRRNRQKSAGDKARGQGPGDKHCRAAARDTFDIAEPSRSSRARAASARVPRSGPQPDRHSGPLSGSATDRASGPQRAPLRQCHRSAGRRALSVGSPLTTAADRAASANSARITFARSMLGCASPSPIVELVRSAMPVAPAVFASRSD